MGGDRDPRGPAVALWRRTRAGRWRTAIVADVDAVRADRRAVVDRVRRECPRWDGEDVHWAVQGIAEMDPGPFARWLRALAGDEGLRTATPDRIGAVAPERPRPRRRSASGRCSTAGRRWPRPTARPSRRRLPPGHVIGIAGGHCLHRDAPDEWLAAVEAIIC